MSLDIEEQYDKIYRYCYYRLRNREQAEDVTQETFLRWFSSDTYHATGQALRYLYTIARNLCIDEYRRTAPEPLPEENAAPEKDVLSLIALRTELSKLNEEDRELILLYYVNNEPIGVLCGLYGVSRFALYRRLQRLKKALREALCEE